MKTLYSSLFLALSLFITASCSDYNLSDPADTIFEDTATITEPDMRRCACCGGWFIEIEEETKRFYELPEKSFDIEMQELPVNVELNWSADPNACLGDEIIIDKIEKL